MSSDPSSDPYFSEHLAGYYNEYKLAVYDNLSTGTVFGKGQEIRYSPNF